MIIAVFIFSMVLFLFYNVRPNIESQKLNKLNEMYLEAKTLTDSLATQGYPYDWNITNFQRVGLTDGGIVIEPEKLAQFKNLTITNYELTKDTFNMAADYAVLFTDVSDEIINLDGISLIGEPGVAIVAGKMVVGKEYGNLVSLSRIMIYNETTVKMVVYTWR